jgi:hypothetical protein
MTWEQRLEASKPDSLAQELAVALEDSSERLAVLERRRARIISERDDLVIAALIAGMTKADIARACGMSRGRVNQILLRPSVKARLLEAQGPPDPVEALMRPETRRLLQGAGGAQNASQGQ